MNGIAEMAVHDIERLVESGLSAFEAFDYTLALNYATSVIDQCNLDVNNNAALEAERANIVVRASLLAVQSSLMLGDMGVALATYQNVSVVVNNYGSTFQQATLLNIYGQILAESGDHSQGLQVLKQCQNLFETIVSSDQAVPYTALQLPCLVILGMNAEAEELCRRCEQGVQHIPRIISAANQLRLVGLTYLHLGDVERASRLLLQCYEHAVQLGELNDVVLCSLAYGRYLIRIAKYDEVHTLLNAALELATSKMCLPLMANTFTQLGYVSNMQSEYSQSAMYYTKSITIWKQLGRQFQLAQASIACANCYIFTSDFQRALALLEEALAIGQEHAYTKIISSSNHELANIYYYLKDFDACETCYRNALIEAMRTGSRQSVATCTGNLGIALLNQLKYDEALLCMQFAIDEMKSMGFPSEVARHTMNAGVAFLDQLRYEPAKEYLEKAMHSLRLLNMGHELANVLLNLGRLYGDDASPYRDVGTCETVLMESLDLHLKLGIENGVSRVHQLLGMLYEDLEQWPKAMLHLKEYHSREQKRINEQAVQNTKMYEQKRLVFQAEHMLQLKNVEHEATMEQSRMQQLLQKQKLEHAEHELETAVKELAKKNELLEQLLQQGDRLRDHLRGTGNDLLDQMLEKVSRNIIPLEEATEIRNSMNHANSHWIIELRKSYPSITTMEEKIAILIRMNLPSESIASALCVSKRTVEFHRLNLRKKLGLSKDQGLREVLYTFRSS